MFPSYAVSNPVRLSTHRERTQNYIKSLEAEVLRLRGSENALIQEKENLQGKVDILKTTCILSGTPHPASVEETATTLSDRHLSHGLATVSMHADEMNNQRLYVDWTSPQSSSGPHEGNSQASQAPTSEAARSHYGTPQPAPGLPNSEASLETTTPKLMVS